MTQILQQMVATLTALVAALSAQVASLPNAVPPNTQMAAVASSVNNTGLVGYWKFDEKNGTIAADSSGAGNIGTLVNGPTWTAGKMGGAISFDGSNDFVNTNYSISSYPASICAWIYYAKNTGMFSSIAGNDAFSLNLINDPRNQDYIQIFNNQNAASSDPGSVFLGAWTHVCGTVDSKNNASIYINGALKSGPKNIGAIIITNKVAIGAASGGNAQRFKGLIDEVRIYNKALTAQEISGIYNGRNF